MENIEDCPWCKSSYGLDIATTNSQFQGTPIKIGYVRCKECRAQGPDMVVSYALTESDKNEIIQQWNRGL